MAVFAGLLVVFYAVILIPAVDRLFFGYLCVNATVANGLLHALGHATTVTDTTIRSADFAVSVRRGCDALEPAWFFAAAVLAFPGPWRRKLAGIAVGVAAILALNQVRIVSLYLIGRSLPRYFGPAHLEWWPVVFIIVALLLWLAWIRWSRANARTEPATVDEGG